MLRLMLCLSLACTALGCGSSSGSGGTADATGSDASSGDGSVSGDGCEACLASGGTWQPEADECTQGCDIQDISCFTDSCPGACAADTCGSCFSPEACEGAGCTWSVAGEAMWCTSGTPGGGGDAWTGADATQGSETDAAVTEDAAGPGADTLLPTEDTATTDTATTDTATTDTATTDTATAGDDTADTATAGDDTAGSAPDTSVPPDDVAGPLEDATAPGDPCEACLASGGTWQPEAGACTDACAIQDISCFTDGCPAPCSADACGGCFTGSDCETAGCTWSTAGESMWCTASAGGTDDATTSPDTSSPAADAGPTEDADVPAGPCEECLAQGKTWQPEASACTDACAIQDISCYVSECPAACSPSSCGTCLSQDHCEANGCTWSGSGGLFWCSG